MKLLLFVLLLVAGPAFAQPAQWPKPFGPGTIAQIGEDDACYAAVWGYTNGIHSSHAVLAAKKGHVPADFSAQLTQAALAGTPAKVSTALDALWKKYAVGPPPLECDPLANELALKVTLPPSPVFKVAPNGASTTRPAYPLSKAKGLDLTKETGRPAVGATCDCRYGARRGSVIYCAVAEPFGDAVQAAVCRTN